MTLVDRMNKATRAARVARRLGWTLTLGGVSAFAQTASPPAAQATAAPQGSTASQAMAEPEELPLDDAAGFAHARSFYEVSDYKGCQEAFSTLLRVDAPNRLKNRALIEEARIYKAACLLGLGRPRDADEQLKVAIRTNPLIAAPDPVIFPALFVNRFFAVRSQMLEEIRRAEEQRVERLRREAEAEKRQDAAVLARIAELERIAGRESVVQQNSRWLAAVPYGVGQFQNREQGWGYFFLTSELVLTASAITAVSIQLSLHAQAAGGQTIKDTDEINRRLELAHTIEIGSLVGLVSFMGLGILQAQLAYVPEHRLPDRPRTLKGASPKPKLEPSLAPTTGGALLGLSGTF
jgi:hypothetical protein